jgi:signal transduction histidine kinase
MKQVAEFFRKLFDTSDWPPRWHCGKWSEFHGWLYIISDILVWSAYFAIPLIIIRYISKKHDARFIRLYFLFAGFILACGSTHFFDAVTFWFPVYRINALVRAITGILSWFTVFYLIKVLPQAFTLRSSAELEAEVEQRKQAEEKFRNLSETLEKKVQQRTAELERKNKELEQFAYVASHDLQEPLQTTSGFVQLLRKQYQGRLDPTADQYIEYVVQASGRMKTLIKDLLDYSRIGRGNDSPQVDCNVLVQEVLADLHKVIVENNVQINTGQLPMLHNAFPTELKSLFQNLVSNSIKFRKPGIQPVLHIDAVQANGFWQFSVRDNGIGIEDQYLERIFVIFQRLHNRSMYDGSGIGLAHCKKIAELHGGKIWVESEPGKGSTFYFTIADGTH